MQIIHENKENVPESGTLSNPRLSRWEDDCSVEPLYWSYLKYPVYCAGWCCRKRGFSYKKVT